MQSDCTYISRVPNKRSYAMLRFRTKKQHADIKKAAKEQKFSVNEYILRILEEKHDNSPKQDQEQQAAGN